MSNSKQMTLEERIVQTLKDDKLMTLVGDEDAIRELVVRALKEALFEERTVPDGAYRTKTEPSMVVKAAREAADKAATEAAGNMVAEILAIPAIRDEIMAVLPSLIVQALVRKSELAWDQFRDQAAMDAVNRIQTAMQGRFIP